MQYRPEIDGLRAIAVVPVILFHADVSLFSGGFVGVDVFFVISGFLITTLILREQDRGQFSLLTFYERRARRILPALFLVVSATILPGYVLMTPWDFSEFMRSVAAAALFLSNVHFWENTGYFALAAEKQPLLHTWSLAVEEQFYLLFPLLLLVPFQRAVLSGIVLAMFCASLALAQWGATYEPDVNFFFTPSRVWELMAGALCAFWQVSRQPKPNELAAAAGLAMVLISIFFYDRAIPFPSLYTLLPVGGTALLLLYAHRGTRVHTILSSAPLIGIGLVSYSAYLWHQPLFAFARMSMIEPLVLWQTFALILITFALAYLTWLWIEQPVRKSKSGWFRTRGYVFALSATGIGALVLSFMTLDNEQRFYASLSAEQRRYLPYLNYASEARNEENHTICSLGSANNNLAFFDRQECLKISESMPNVLLMGDSHASHFYKALAQVFPEANILRATASGCRPLLDYSGQKRCTDLARFLLEDFLATEEVDAVIISARWRQTDEGALRSTFAYLRSVVPNVVVMGPTMEYDTDLPKILMKYADRGQEEITQIAAQLRREDRTEMSRKVALASNETGAVYVDVQETLCPDDVCLIFTPDGAPITWDYGHFTDDAALWIIQEMRDSGALRLEAIGAN